MTEEYLPPLAMVLPVASGQIGPNYGDYGQSVDILRKARIEIGLGPQGQLYPSMTSGGRYPVDTAGQSIATSISGNTVVTSVSGNSVVTSVSGNVVRQSVFGSPVAGSIVVASSGSVMNVSGTPLPSNVLTRGVVVVTNNGPAQSAWITISGNALSSGMGLSLSSPAQLEGIANTNLIWVTASNVSGVIGFYGA